MSIETEARLTIGWRVDAEDIPDLNKRHWDDEWKELEYLVDRAGEAFSEELYREDLCEEENQLTGETFIIGIPTAKNELSMHAFMTDMELRAMLVRRVYEQVMREPPKDGPYMISWTHVW